MTSNPLAALEGRRSEFEALCRELGAHLVYLFGSQARGQAFPFSDVDFAVAFAPEVPAAELSQRQVEMITELMSLLKRNDVDVAVLERATPLLRHRAATEGIVVYQADPFAHADFLVRALREYDDTRSLREAEAAALKARYGRR